MRYSVIIPVYNEKETICRCLDSIIPQLPKDSELLLIDDGSNDGTEKICFDYAVRFPQIKLLTKQNGGVSSARNLGLDNAAGEYVLFVDADDAVTSNYFTVLDDALKDNPDLVFFKKLRMEKIKDRSYKRNRDYTISDKKNGCRFLSECLLKQELNLITSKAFRRDIIEKNGLRFDERLEIGEDKVFSFAFSLQAKNVRTVSARIYCLYTDDPASLSRKKRAHLCESVILEHELLFSILKDSSLSEKEKSCYVRAISYSFHRGAYTVAAELRKFDINKKERVAKTAEILNAFSERKEIKYYDPFHFLFAQPVRCKQPRIVDDLISIAKHIGVA